MRISKPPQLLTLIQKYKYSILLISHFQANPIYMRPFKQLQKIAQKQAYKQSLTNTAIKIVNAHRKMRKQPYAYNTQFIEYLSRYLATKMRVDDYVSNLVILLSVNNHKQYLKQLASTSFHTHEPGYQLDKYSKIDRSVLYKAIRQQTNLIKILKFSMLVQKCITDKPLHVYDCQLMIAILLDKCNQHRQYVTHKSQQIREGLAHKDNRVQQSRVEFECKNMDGKSLNFVNQKIIQPYLCYLRKRLMDATKSNTQYQQQCGTSTNTKNHKHILVSIHKQVEDILQQVYIERHTTTVLKDRLVNSQIMGTIRPKKIICTNRQQLKNLNPQKKSIAQFTLKNSTPKYRSDKQNISTHKQQVDIQKTGNCNHKHNMEVRMGALQDSIVWMLQEKYQECYYLLNLIKKATVICRPLITLIRYFGGYWGCIQDFNVYMAEDVRTIYQRINLICTQIQELFQIWNKFRLGCVGACQVKMGTSMLTVRSSAGSCQSLSQNNSRNDMLIRQHRHVYEILEEIQKVNQELYLLYYNCYYNKRTRIHAPNFIDIDSYATIINNPNLTCQKDGRGVHMRIDFENVKSCAISSKTGNVACQTKQNYISSGMLSTVGLSYSQILPSHSNVKIQKPNRKINKLGIQDQESSTQSLCFKQQAKNQDICLDAMDLHESETQPYQGQQGIQNQEKPQATQYNNKWRYSGRAQADIQLLMQLSQVLEKINNIQILRDQNQEALEQDNE